MLSWWRFCGCASGDGITANANTDVLCVCVCVCTHLRSDTLVNIQGYASTVTVVHFSCINDIKSGLFCSKRKPYKNQLSHGNLTYGNSTNNVLSHIGPKPKHLKCVAYTIPKCYTCPGSLSNVPENSHSFLTLGLTLFMRNDSSLCTQFAHSPVSVRSLLESVTRVCGLTVKHVGPSVAPRWPTGRVYVALVVPPIRRHVH